MSRTFGRNFSLAVAGADALPKMQRFGFLVRNRVITDEEASAFLAAKAGVLSPYQRFRLAALREMSRADARGVGEVAGFVGAGSVVT